jgi:hypothetical protein
VTSDFSRTLAPNRNASDRPEDTGFSEAFLFADAVCQLDLAPLARLAHLAQANA